GEPAKNVRNRWGLGGAFRGECLQGLINHLAVGAWREPDHELEEISRRIVSKNHQLAARIAVPEPQIVCGQIRSVHYFLTSSANPSSTASSADRNVSVSNNCLSFALVNLG